MPPRRDFIKQFGMVYGGLTLSGLLPAFPSDEIMKEENAYEVIIVGGSYAGLAAGMALGRAMRKTAILDSGNPCNHQTPYSHNFLTQDGIPPGDIARLAKQQVQQYPTVHFRQDEVTAVLKEEQRFSVKTKLGETLTAAKLVLATGIRDRMPDIPGFSACWGISVLHCPYCHGYEVRHRKTGILANGNEGFALATLITNWTHDLALYTNGPSTLSDQEYRKLHAHGIPVIEKEITQIAHQQGHIENLRFHDGTVASVQVLYSRLPFEQHTPLPSFLGCEISAEGYVKVDATQRTSVDGVYACGDNASKMRTVANAVATGTTAGMMVNKEILEEAFYVQR